MCIACVQDLEGYWLASTPFMAGDAISIADLLVVMELTQLNMLDGALKVTSGTGRATSPHARVRHTRLNGTKGSEAVSSCTAAHRCHCGLARLACRPLHEDIVNSNSACPCQMYPPVQLQPQILSYSGRA